MKAVWLALAAATLVLTGCGKEERSEAARLQKILTDNRAAYTKADALEKEFVANARAWCGGITASGSGKGAALEQNAVVATELAKNASAVSNELSRVRQAVSDQPLNKEYPQSVRNDLVMKIAQRQRMLQDLRSLLDHSAPQFREFASNRSYAGDSYPGEIAKLDAMLGAYRPPDDAVGTALAALDTKYHLGR